MFASAWTAAVMLLKLEGSARFGNRGVCASASVGWSPTWTPQLGETQHEKPRTDRRNAKPKVKMVYRGMLYHDLRRTAVRNLVRSGTPKKVNMKFSGHLGRRVFDRYDITTDKDALESGERLAAYLEKVGDKTGPTVHQNAAARSTVN